MILKDAPFLISTHSFLVRNNKATYTYAITLFRQLGYIYLSKSSDIPCTYPHWISKGYQEVQTYKPAVSELGF
jgi:hypothetical protein